MTGATAIVVSAFTFGAQVTPDVVNWPNIAGAFSASKSDQTISGINTPITLRIDWTGTAVLNWMLNDTTSATLTTGSSIGAHNLDKISFNLIGVSAGTVTITNVSDSNTVLDTFTYSLYSTDIF